MPNGTIYALIDPQSHEHRYVGATIRRLSQRLGDHIHSARRLTRRSPSNIWIAELLKAGLRPRILALQTEVVSERALDEAERHWLRLGAARGWPLTNLQLGGRAAPHATITKNKIRAHANPWHRGKHWSEEHRRALSEGQRRRFARAEERQRLSEAHRGQSPAMKGKHFPADHPARLKKCGANNPNWKGGRHA